MSGARDLGRRMPSFYGGSTPREYFKWEVEVDRLLDKYYPHSSGEHQVAIITREFREYAYE